MNSFHYWLFGFYINTTFIQNAYEMRIWLMTSVSIYNGEYASVRERAMWQLVKKCRLYHQNDVIFVYCRVAFPQFSKPSLSNMLLISAKDYYSFDHSRLIKHWAFQMLYYQCVSAYISDDIMIGMKIHLIFCFLLGDLQTNWKPYLKN